jgi:transglutaminase-like putative cysteine protease
MSRLFTICCLLIFSFSFTEAHPGGLVKSFPAPGKFCTGLTYDGMYLWAADYKSDLLFQINPNDGSVVRKILSPGFWPMGLAWDGQALWCVDAKAKKIFKIDPQNGTILFTVDAPTSNPEGLTWDGTTLWVGDSRADKIMKLDLSDGTAVKSVSVPARAASGLTFDGTYLWCSDRELDEIYMIDPENGDVLIMIDAPGNYCRGIAYDGTYLWNIDYQSDSLYQIIRSDDEPYQLSEKRHAKITLTHQVKVYEKGQLQNLDVFLAIPEGKPQQKIISTSFYPDKYSTEKDRWQQPLAVFSYKDQLAGSVIESRMEVQAEISAIRYFIFPDRCGTLGDIPSEIRKMYTADGSKYLLNEPYISDLAKKIVAGEKSPYWIARKIFDYVRKTLEYKLEGGWNVAPVVLQRGTGSCSEYTFSFIALCRAAGLPARYVGAIVVRGDDASLDEVFHRWPEVYLPNYGWIPIDPQGGDKELPRDSARYIGQLSNRFLITTQGGGDSEYLGWYYNYNERYQTDPQVKVNIETFAEWEPSMTK